MDYNIIKGKSVLTNTGDDFVGTLSVNDTALTNYAVYLVQMPITNTTISPTLNLNAIGVKNILANGGGAVSIGQLVQYGWYLLVYQSSNDSFIVIN